MMTTSDGAADQGRTTSDHESALDHLGHASPVVTRLHELVVPIVADLGLDLYDLEFAGGFVRITVDTHPGSPGGVDVDQLARVTRLVSRELDHVDPIPGHYTLEVSSPGLERNLRTPQHFARETGKPVAIRLRHASQGERRVAGTLVGAGPDSFTVRDDAGAERVISYADVDRARTVFVWEAQPKPGRRKSGGAGGSSPAKGPARAGGTSSSSRTPADFAGRKDDTPDDEMSKQEDQESAES